MVQNGSTSEHCCWRAAPPFRMPLGPYALGNAQDRYFLKVPKWDLTSTLIAFDIVPVLLCVLAFRSTGFEQIGYRFSLDFLPFVFLLLMRSPVAMTGNFKVLILLSTIIDLFLTAFHMVSGVDRRQG